MRPTASDVPICHYRLSRVEYDRAVEAGAFEPAAKLELIDGDLNARTPEGVGHTTGMDLVADCRSRRQGRAARASRRTDRRRRSASLTPRDGATRARPQPRIVWPGRGEAVERQTRHHVYQQIRCHQDCMQAILLSSAVFEE